MFTIVGYSQSQDTGGVLTAVDALLDPHVRVQGKDVIVPSLNKLIGAFVTGANAQGAQFQSPTLRRFVNLDLYPFNQVADTGSPFAFIDRSEQPIELTVDEALNAYYAESAAGAERCYIAALLGDGDHRIPSGEIFTVRASGTTTLVANAWTNVPLTFTQVLPAGRYACVGAQAYTANGVFFRFYPNAFEWRPGYLTNGFGFAGMGSRQRYGGLGVWFEFNHNTPPTCDFLANGASTSENVWLDLIKIS